MNNNDGDDTVSGSTARQRVDDVALLTASDAARRLGIARGTLARAVRRGDIVPVHDASGRRRFLAAGVDAYARRRATAQRGQPSDRPDSAAPAPPSSPAPLGGTVRAGRPPLLAATILETIADSFFAVDHDWRLTYVNSAAERRSSRSRGELLGMNIWEAFPLAVGTAFYTEAHRAVAEGVPIEFTAYYAPNDRWVEGRVYPTPDGVLGYFRDISRRQQAEQSLRESEQRFRTLIELSPIAMCITDAHGVYETVNDAYCALYGYTAAELIGHPFTLIVPPEQRAALARRYAQGYERQGESDGEYEVLTRDGRRLSVLTKTISIAGMNGRIKRASWVVDFTGHKQLEETLRHQALHDALTDLPNRTLLYERLHAAIRAALRDDVPVALLLLDLDRFKEVNDAFGHHHGDALLRQIADRLRAALRMGDTVARLGGDEFAVVLPAGDRDAATHMAARFNAALEQPFVVEGQIVHLRGSTGIALCPAHGLDADTLLRRADVAMYAAKRGGQSSAVYAPERDAFTPDRLALTGDLRQAIDSGGLLLHYQPKLDLERGQIVAVEALARWPHPRHGLVPPDQFIPLAETSGLISALTLTVLGAALRQSHAWRAAGLPLTIAVNLSAASLHDPQLPETVARLLRRHGVPPAALRVEVTESMLLSDTTRAQEVLARLAAFGVGISIDDFGTGYSSLAYLKRLPVDEIKIDKSFVLDMAVNAADASIVASTIGLAHSLGLRVVAEGVENLDAQNLLAAMGCDVIQGYFVTRPLPAPALESWLSAAPWPLAPHDTDV